MTIKLYRTRRENVAVSLVDRTTRINNNPVKIKLVVSLHVNGSLYATAMGFDSHIYTTPSATSIQAQEIFQKHLGPFFIKWGSKDRGPKRNNFHMVRETWCPAILTENGFMSNAEDMARWKNPAFVHELAQTYVIIFKELEALGIDVIWIDEGHGGSSPGAVAADGTREADLVLMLSNKIEELLFAPPDMSAEVERLTKELAIKQAQVDGLQVQLNQESAAHAKTIDKLNKWQLWYQQGASL